MEPAETFARNVAQARTRAGMTQEDVAGRSGVHPTEVSRIERGQRDPRVSTVVRLAAALGVPPGRLFDGL
jgi:transcriptional regulator with XRE-family HTH domain